MSKPGAVVIHQIILQDSQSGPGIRYVARCGHEHHRRPSEPIPPDFTVWQSRTTCEECWPPA